MMSTAQVLEITGRYEGQLVKEGVSKRQIDGNRTFASLSNEEMLAHALYLCENVRIFATQPHRYDKMMRHFASLQMCLSFADLYTLNELQQHNAAQNRF